MKFFTTQLKNMLVKIGSFFCRDRCKNFIKNMCNMYIHVCIFFDTNHLGFVHFVNSFGLYTFCLWKNVPPSFCSGNCRKQKPMDMSSTIIILYLHKKLQTITMSPRCPTPTSHAIEHPLLQISMRAKSSMPNKIREPPEMNLHFGPKG